MSSFVKSIRVSPELWARVEAWAAEHEITANAAAWALIAAGLNGPVAHRIERRVPDPKAAGATPPAAAKP